jgi:hypothetical protein
VASGAALHAIPSIVIFTITNSISIFFATEVTEITEEKYKYQNSNLKFQTPNHF